MKIDQATHATPQALGSNGVLGGWWRRKMTDDDKVLAFDPFQGDFGDQGDRVFKNKIGIARKAGECNDCAQQIQRGERVRLMTARFDGELMHYRWCALCCAAMAKYQDDDGDAYEARCALRFAATREPPNAAGKAPAAPADGRP